MFSAPLRLCVKFAFFQGSLAIGCARPRGEGRTENPRRAGAGSGSGTVGNGGGAVWTSGGTVLRCDMFDNSARSGGGLLLDVRQQVRDPGRLGPVRIVTAAVGPEVAQWKKTVLLVVQVQPQADLLEVVGTLRPPSSLPGRLNGRQ